MANFIDFIIDVSKDKKMAKEAVSKLKKATPDELRNWFKEKGYEIADEECIKLMKNKNNLIQIGDVTVKGDY